MIVILNFSSKRRSSLLCLASLTSLTLQDPRQEQLIASVNNSIEYAWHCGDILVTLKLAYSINSINDIAAAECGEINKFIFLQ